MSEGISACCMSPSRTNHRPKGRNSPDLTASLPPPEIDLRNNAAATSSTNPSDSPHRSTSWRPADDDINVSGQEHPEQIEFENEQARTVMGQQATGGLQTMLCTPTSLSGSAQTVSTSVRVSHGDEVQARDGNVCESEDAAAARAMTELNDEADQSSFSSAAQVANTISQSMRDVALEIVQDGRRVDRSTFRTELRRSLIKTVKSSFALQIANFSTANAPASAQYNLKFAVALAEAIQAELEERLDDEDGILLHSSKLVNELFDFILDTRDGDDTLGSEDIRKAYDMGASAAARLRAHCPHHLLHLASKNADQRCIGMLDKGLRLLNDELGAVMHLLEDCIASEPVMSKIESTLACIAEESGHPFPIPLMSIRWSSTFSTASRRFFESLDRECHSVMERFVCIPFGISRLHLSELNEHFMQELLTTSDSIGGKYNYNKYTSAQFVEAVRAACPALVETHLNGLIRPFLARLCETESVPDAEKSQISRQVGGEPAAEGTGSMGMAAKYGFPSQAVASEIARKLDATHETVLHHFPEDVLHALFDFVDIYDEKKISKKDFRKLVRAVGDTGSPSNVFIAILQSTDRRGRGYLELPMVTQLLQKLVRLLCALARDAVTVIVDQILTADNVLRLVELIKKSASNAPDHTTISA